MTDRFEATILRLLDARAAEATICPSEVARELGTPRDWRELMDPVREAARRLVDQEQVEVTQGGRPVDLDEARGPIRIRRRR